LGVQGLVKKAAGTLKGMAKVLKLDGIPPVGFDTSIAGEIADRLAKAIVGQGLTTGDLLPGGIPIAAALKVSRPEVIAALHQLEAAGIIAVRVGAPARVL